MESIGSTSIFEDTLRRPISFDSIDLSSLASLATAKKSALNDVKYWGGDPLPWRNGTTDQPIDNPAVIDAEEACKKLAEADDEIAGWNSEMLRARGIRIDFLLHLTFVLDLWKWKTWEVVQFLVKPATENNDRCRFSDLPVVEPFTGPASIFMSHCWGGLWGDLVAAACKGAQVNRVVLDRRFRRATVAWEWRRP